MSQRPRSQKSRSQREPPQQSQRSNLSQADLTQTRLEQFLEAAGASDDTFDLNEEVNKCVRFLVYCCGHHMHIRKSELHKSVIPKPNRQFEQILQKATEILRKVYGLNLLVCDQGAKIGKAYILSNALPHFVADDDNDEPEPNKILLLLILTHILMSAGPVSDSSINSFLRTLQINVTSYDANFGSVKDHIANVLVKQKFLTSETDPISKKVMFDWGIRAEKEISKHEILQFVCKIYKDRLPRAWENQFRIANEQAFENHKHTVQNETMETGDESD